MLYLFSYISGEGAADADMDEAAAEAAAEADTAAAAEGAEAAAEAEDATEAAAEAAAAEKGPVKLGYRTFNDSKEVVDYLHEVLKKAIPHRKLNEVCACKFRREEGGCIHDACIRA